MEQHDRGQFADTFVTARDGLRLHVREYGARADRVPVVCLPGLTRTAADFHDLASALSSGERPRHVLALDYRGRGESAYDPDPGNYSVAVELDDVLSVIAAREATPAIFIGTSRGGLITMALSVARPTVIAAAVLNDIGPVIELRGLMRIKGYVGGFAEPQSHEHAADLLQQAFGAQFPALARADWIAWAQRGWKREADRLVPTYDPKLAAMLAGVAPDRPLPALWAQFDALAGVPLMIVRGENSDLLSRETFDAMRARRPDATAIEVPGQGHAPLLAEAPVIRQVRAFVDAPIQRWGESNLARRLFRQAS